MLLVAAVRKRLAEAVLSILIEWPPGSPPSRAAMSYRLFGLRHFNSTRG